MKNLTKDWGLWNVHFSQVRFVEREHMVFALEWRQLVVARSLTVAVKKAVANWLEFNCETPLWASPSPKCTDCLSVANFLWWIATLVGLSESCWLLIQETMEGESQDWGLPSQNDTGSPTTEIALNASFERPFACAALSWCRILTSTLNRERPHEKPPLMIFTMRYSPL